MAVQFEDCSPGHSFFKLIVDHYWTRTSYGRTIHRICTLMRKMEVRSYAEEKLETEGPDAYPPLAIELAAIRARVGTNAIRLESFRLTFARKDRSECHIEQMDNDDFLGYVIINTMHLPKNKSLSYVFESIIREPARYRPGANGKRQWIPLLNNYLHVKRTYKCSVGGHDYKISGTYFCQQNGITSVCAHACAAMVINCSIDREQPVTCEEINQKIGIRHEDRVIWSEYAESGPKTRRGLTNGHLAKAFQCFGLESHEYQCSDSDQREYYRPFIYGFIESGFPAILQFMTPKSDHVLAVVGHTLNSDSWFPGAFATYTDKTRRSRAYLSSIDWMADFLVNDDNFGMYLCLPGHAFHPEEQGQRGLSFEPATGIGVCRANTMGPLRGWEAEAIAYYRLIGLFNNPDPALRNAQSVLKGYYYTIDLGRNINSCTPVFRVMSVTREQYLDHLDEKDYEGNSISVKVAQRAAIAALLQNYERFWLVEATVPDLYVGNKSKIVDILVSKDAKCSLARLKNYPHETDGIILMRFPGALVVPSGVISPAYKIRRGLVVKSHMPLLSLDPKRSRDSVW